MKVVILAGGLGTRLSEETEVRPKPMVEIGGLPILWHIMKIYGHYGFKDFIIALGYRGDHIKRFFLDYRTLGSDLSIPLRTGKVHWSGEVPEEWNISLIETGLQTMTGGRVKRLLNLIGDETFLMAYGDGVADIDVNQVIEFHRSHGKLATMAAVRPPARFGELTLSDGKVSRFAEKPRLEQGWINGGFFVLNAGIGRYIQGDATSFEKEPLEGLVKDD
jgi:glucose-1-phosphate cytidylyltransferase